MNTHELLQSYAAMKGMADATFDENGTYYMQRQDSDLVVSLESNKEQNKLLVAIEVARLSDQEIALFAGALLALNAGLLVTERGSFVLEGEGADIVSLMRFFSVAELSVSEFAEQMEDLLALAKEWQERLLQPDMGLDDGGTEGLGLGSPSLLLA